MLHRAAARPRFDQLHRAVLRQLPDVEADKREVLLREVGKLLGAEAAALFDVEPQQLPPQRVTEEKKERLIGIFDLRRHG